MPPKGGNAKKESGRAKKAENERVKAAEADVAKERKVADEWSKGAKVDKAAEEKAKKEAAAARKAEAARLLAEEEASIGTSKPKPSGSKKAPPKPKPAGPGAIAAGGLDIAPVVEGKGKAKEEPAESYVATGLDDALDLMEVINAKTDNASVGQAAAGIERHPERRFKAAYEAYQEKELPNIRQEHPGLRLQQYKDLLYKQFQKSPDNPFNQATVSYDASKEEKLETLKKRQEAVEERLREKGKRE